MVLESALANSSRGRGPVVDKKDPPPSSEAVPTNNDILAPTSDQDFYATLPKHPSLLCCVCHEHNTTFRYEVVYKSSLSPKKQQSPLVKNQGSLTSKALAAPEQTSPALTFEGGSQLQFLQATLTTSLETETEDDDEHAYYNFPPRHPRHGHLKWPVWRPLTASPTSDLQLTSESIFVTTYPDYPVHLPTVTLKRVASVIKRSHQKGRLYTHHCLRFDYDSSGSCKCLTASA